MGTLSSSYDMGENLWSKFDNVPIGKRYRLPVIRICNIIALPRTEY